MRATSPPSAARVLLAGLLVLGAVVPALAESPAPAGGEPTLVLPPPAPGGDRASLRRTRQTGPSVLDLTQITRRPIVASGPALIRLPPGCDYLAPVDGKLFCASTRAAPE